VKAKLEMIEGVLLQADIGGSTTSAIITDLQDYARTERLQEGDIVPVLRERLIEALTLKGTTEYSRYTLTLPRLLAGITILYAIMFHHMHMCISVYSGLRFSSDPSKPTVLFVIGANGMGKTTTIGKIASE